MKLKSLFTIIAPVAPLILRMLYFPFETYVLRDVFGCTSDSINEIASKIFVPIAYVCSVVLLAYSSSSFAGIKKYVYLIVCGFIQILLSMFFLMLYVFHGVT